MRFNPPPGWPAPPEGWRPPAGWTPDPSWPDPPPGWQLWIAAPSVDAPERDKDGEVAEDDQDGSDTSGELGAVSQPDDNAELAARVAELERRNAALLAQLASGATEHSELIDLNDEHVLQAAGVYRYHHPLENAATYRERLRDLSSRIADAVRSGDAIEASTTFTYDNSLAKGRRMVADLSRLMLRAYNAEAENAVRTMRAGTVANAKKRLDAARSAIARLGATMDLHISDTFHQLRSQEIELTADWLMRKEQEKEEAREHRAQLREQRRVEQELAAQRAKLDKEREHLTNALAALRRSGQDDAELTAQLAAVDEAIATNDYRAANVRAGYVYVISNRGAFGPGVVKIGLTRRLEPMDRVRELGDASVPFHFDVHALFFSDDAVGVEADLHRRFADRAVNQVNVRKEFFFASPGEVRDALADTIGTSLLEYAETPTSEEFWQSVPHWPDSLSRRPLSIDRADLPPISNDMAPEPD